MAKTTTSSRSRKTGPTITPTALPGERVKTFAPAEDDIIDLMAAPVRFAVVFTRRRTEQETHEFAARPEVSYKDSKGVALASKVKNDAGALLIFERLIRNCLLDDDGTPAHWAPEVDDGRFLDPEGVERDATELNKVLDPAAGSSLRRWIYLMDHPDNEDLSVQLKQIADVWEFLVAEAAGRPTRRSSR